MKKPAAAEEASEKAAAAPVAAEAEEWLGRKPGIARKRRDGNPFRGQCFAEAAGEEVQTTDEMVDAEASQAFQPKGSQDGVEGKEEHVKLEPRAEREELETRPAGKNERLEAQPEEQQEGLKTRPAGKDE
ncbi:unnamed protein product [Cladocopium goreaui]|uniref:Uncharacterized protein n=1 Tax=Cladocopium goreaui TaxID=2562237 RepID=A0A9P1G4Z3_9DINO|nr:unnamed protein product [Cladocopium goreaui]